MDVESIQKRRREFATERDWNQYHSPKNLSFASEVEAAELMEIFDFGQVLINHQNTLPFSITLMI